MSTLLAVLVLAAVWGGLPCTHARAGQAFPATNSSVDNARKDLTLPSVTVTAEKRETDVQQTPSAITVMTGQALQDAAVFTIDEVMERIPNLEAGTLMGSMQFMTYRGVPSAGGTNTNPLVMYIDGVPADTFFNFDANLADIERIEVLRGGQSAIYGKNTLGGIINVITKKPDNEWAGKVSSRVETWDGYALDASVSGPLVEDRLAFSLSVDHDLQGGFMDNRYSHDRDSTSNDRVKSTFRLTPSDDVDLAFIIDYGVSETDMNPYSLGKSVSMTSEADEDDFLDTEILNLGLTGKFRFTPFIFETVTTGRFDWEEYVSDMGNMVPGLGDGTRKTQRREATQEFRLRSPEGEDGLTWITGLYASYVDLDICKMSQKYQPMGPIQLGLDQPYREYAKELAPFAQVDIPLGASWTVTTGLRWHYTGRDASISYEPNADMQTLFGAQPMQTDASDSWTEWLPRLGLQYQFTDDHMLHAGISRSFIPGGFNYASTTEDEFTYNSQTAWNYELGAKTSWMGRRLTINPVLFYSQIEDLQVMNWDAAAGIYTARNAGKATSYGAELDVAYRILPGLDAEANLGYTHARYDEYAKETASGLEVYDDKEIPMAPEYSGLLGLQYRHDSGLFGRVEARHTSKFYWDEGNTVDRDPVTVVNTKLGYEMESFDVYVYGKNIFDARYHQYFSAPLALGFTAQPQTFGLEVAYRF